MVAGAQTDPDTVDGHVAAAKAAAGSDYAGIVATDVHAAGSARAAQCDAGRAATGGRACARHVVREAGEGLRQPLFRRPDRVFGVGGDDADGIIIIDPIFDYSVEEEVVNGLKALGFDPNNIKYVLISHAHSDHVGGASFLQDRFNAKVIMSEADWALLEGTKASWRKPRTRAGRDRRAEADARRHDADAAHHARAHARHDLDVDSGARWRHASCGRVLGRHRVQLGGEPHRLHHRRSARTASGSTTTFSRRSASGRSRRNAGADVILSNHTAFDGSKTKLPAMATRRPGDPHPYVVGADSVARYLTVAEECAKAGLLRVK